MNIILESIALNRLKTISVSNNGTVSPRLKAIFLSELASIGYKMENPNMYNDSVFNDFESLMGTLCAMKGGHVKHVPLFSGFPNNVPNKEEFLKARFLGFFGNILGCFDENDADVKVLENGLKIPNWLFDITEFGGDPIFGRQTKELFEQGLLNQEKRKSDTHTEFITLKFSTVAENDVKNWYLNNMYSKSSIKEALKDEIEYCISYYGVDCIASNRVVFKEIKAYIMKYMWEKGNFKTLSKYISHPTDMLRMFAAITDSDISLATNIKFPKMSRSARKFVLSHINDVESLNDYKGLWLELGRYLHPFEYKTLYPKAYIAFDILRNSKVSTFNGRLENAIKTKDLDTTLKMVLSRPGIFGRKIHELVDVFAENNGVISAFKSIAHELELKNLLILEKYFETINTSDYRTVINKKGKVIVFTNKRKGQISEKRLGKLLNGIRKAIATKIQLNPMDIVDGSKVWIAPELRNYMIPLSLRKQSVGLMNIARGSRVKFDTSKVLRLFTYWKEKEHRTDFDLSLIEFDENFNMKGQVSYTNLSSNGIVHSGDMTSSECGATEFIDIDFRTLKKGVKYLAININKFSGESFSQVEESFSGWQIRESVNKDIKSFDIKTVSNKFNVVGNGNVAIPMLIDVENGEIIYIDLYIKGSRCGNRVEGSVDNVAIITKELVNMYNTKPNMYDLINYQINGTKAILVDSKEDADITYGIDDCTYSVDRVDEILSNML